MKRLLICVIVGGFLIGIEPTDAQTAYAPPGSYNNWPPYSYIGYYGYGWTYLDVSNYSRAIGGDLLATNSAGDYVVFNFYGQKVTYWYSKSYNRGRYHVYIDNNFIETVSSCTPYPQVRRQIGRTWTVGSVDANHVLRLVNAGDDPGCAFYGRTMDVDAFSVNVTSYTSAGFGSAASYDDTDGIIRFSPDASSVGEWGTQTGVSGAYFNSFRDQYTSGAFFRFTAVGSSIAYIHSTAYNRGFAEVTIDGESKGYIDSYSGTTYRQQISPFINLNQTLGYGVAIDTHVVHVYISGDRNAASSNIVADVDRVEISHLPGYAEIFNAFRAEYFANHGLSEYIETSDPVLRKNPSLGTEWSYMRPFAQKINTSGGVSGFAEIGHYKSSIDGHKVFYSFMRTDGSTVVGIVPGETPGVGVYYNYEVRRTGVGVWSVYFNLSPAPKMSVSGMGYDIADTWGSGGETLKSNHGMGPATNALQYVRDTAGNLVVPCPNTFALGSNVYSILNGPTCSNC